MTKSTAYETWIELGYNGSENSQEFDEWYNKMEALNQARLDTMFEIIANGLRVSANCVSDDIAEMYFGKYN